MLFIYIISAATLVKDNKCTLKRVIMECIGGGAMKSRDLTSRDLTTRHQIKQIATGWTSVGPRKNRTCWTISELNPVCHDSTAALIVAFSFCVQSAILSALILSPYSRGSTTAATATAARTKMRTGRRLCQQRQIQGGRNRQRQPR